MNWHLFSGFLLILVVMLMMPGPIVTLLVSTAATGGARAGFITIAGTTGGDAILVAIVVGLLTRLSSHALQLFMWLRWVGAAYLLWLGIGMWRSADRPESVVPKERIHFWRGLFVAATNPKTLAFLTALLPQFVDPTLPMGRQLIVMGVSCVVLGSLSDALWVLASSVGAAWLIKPGPAITLQRASGLLLVVGSVWLALSTENGL
jgi:threonine/homoserine/homoserine lactone efflux protein